MASETPSFDFGTDPAPVEAPEGIVAGVLDEPGVEGEPTSRRTIPVMAASAGSEVWREVPQARFLSWSPAMQMAYCMRRDLDSAACAENDWWRAFYARRAEGYR